MTNSTFITADHDYTAYLPSALTPTHVVMVTWPGSGVASKPISHNRTPLVVGVAEAHEMADRMSARNVHASFVPIWTGAL